MIGFTEAKSTAAALGPLLAQIAGSTAGCWPVQLEKRPPALLQALERWRSRVCCCSRARALHAGETGWRALERRRMQHNEGRPHRSGRAIPRTYVDSSFQKWDCAPRRPVGWLLSLALKPRRLWQPTRAPLRPLSCALFLLCLVGAHLRQAQGTSPPFVPPKLQPTSHPPPHHHLLPLPSSRPERCGRHFNQPCRNSYLPSPGPSPACLLHRLRLCIIRAFVQPPPYAVLSARTQAPLPRSRSLHHRPSLLDRAAVHSGGPSPGKTPTLSPGPPEPVTVATRASP